MTSAIIITFCDLSGNLLENVLAAWLRSKGFEVKTYITGRQVVGERQERP